METSASQIFVAASLFLAPYFGDNIDLMKIKAFTDTYKKAQARAEYIVATGDISELQGLLDFSAALEEAKAGNYDALIEILVKEQEAIADGGATISLQDIENSKK